MKNQKLENITLLLMDADGVLTCGSIIYTGAGSETMIFNVKDGLGIKMVSKAGIVVGIVTGRKSAALTRRISELGIELVFDGVSDKGSLFDGILEKTGCKAGETAYIGDDLPDIALMKKVGLPIAVADAQPEVRSCAEIITSRPGGKGAVREICDAILQARGVWKDFLKQWE